MRVHPAVIGALLVLFVKAQQPAGTQMFVDYPGLSDACKRALATNVTCTPLLPIVAPSNSILTLDEVTELCVEDCYTSLKSARATIAAACTASTDVVVIDNVAYPATFFADSYLLTYEVSCLKDSNGNYCDPQLLNWPAGSDSLNTTYQCSECWLSVLSLQLGNPLGYDAGLESNFEALTSSCEASGYGYTAPTAYAINATSSTASATATPTSSDAATQTCSGYYTVQSDDDCNSVAKAHNVSTYGLLEANNLDLYCEMFNAVVGETICIPPSCEIYTWHAWDDCNSVAAQHSGVTLPQFLAWNPMFNSLCLNGPLFDGYAICVSPPGDYLNHTTDASSNQTSTEGGGAAAVPAPTNALDSSNRNCSLWYTVVKGDTCAAVSVAHSISLDDFYFLNPEIDTNCTNLELDVAYCVQPVGSITTYPNYTLTGVLPITVTSATFPSVNTAIPTATNDPGFVYTPPPLLPTASGTLSGCYEYANPGNYTTLCRDLIGSYGISFEQLLDWNPSLDKDKYNCTVSLSNSYCVKQYKNSTAPREWTVSKCLPINATEPGTVSNCDCFNVVDGSGDPLDYSCADFVSDYGVTMSDLLSWNPWLANGDCDAALYASLAETATRAVCIGTGTATSTGTGTGTTSATATRTTTLIGPTQTDTISDCKKFHTVEDGDDCTSIESEYGITLAQFYRWNPSIGSTCTNLWLGYAYCVEGPAASGTSTTTSSLSPTQTGIASNCNRYHNVVKGDSCAQVEEEYGITFAQLYKWNPAIGSDCQALQIGTAVCVGVSL